VPTDHRLLVPFGNTPWFKASKTFAEVTISALKNALRLSECYTLRVGNVILFRKIGMNLSCFASKLPVLISEALAVRGCFKSRNVGVGSGQKRMKRMSIPCFYGTLFHPVSKSVATPLSNIL
jgi:hypothetical protein